MQSATNYLNHYGFFKIFKKSSIPTDPFRSTWFASKIISLSSSSVIFSPNSCAIAAKSSNVIWSFSYENKIKAFSSSFSASRSDIFVVMIFVKSSLVIWIPPSFSPLSPSLFFWLLFRSLINLFISCFAGSNPSARSATFRSLSSIWPDPSVSKRSKASYISASYSTVSSCLNYARFFIFFFALPVGFSEGSDSISGFYFFGS